MALSRYKNQNQDSRPKRDSKQEGKKRVAVKTKAPGSVSGSGAKSSDIPEKRGTGRLLL